MEGALALDFADSRRRDARVYVGGGEHLTTTEPLGPLRDIARDSQGRFSVSATGQLGTFEARLRLLTSGPFLGLLVMEGLHRGDDATLDLFRYLGRRVGRTPIRRATPSTSDGSSSSGPRPRRQAMFPGEPGRG